MLHIAARPAFTRDNVVNYLTDVGQLGAITFEYPPRCLRIRKDGSQWMVKLVCHRSRHLSQQGKIRRLLGLVSQPARLYRGALSGQGIAENVSNDS